MDLAFEDIVARPLALLHRLAQRLGLAGAADCPAVLQQLAALPVPTDAVDPVTQAGGGRGGAGQLVCRGASAAAWLPAC